MFRRKKEHRKALVYYRKAVKMDPKFTDAAWDLAVIYDRMGDAAKSKAAYQAFLKLKSKGKDANFARKRLEQLKGAPKK